MTARKKQRVPRGKTVWLPPLPRYVYSALGDVPVEEIDATDVPDAHKDEVAWWLPRERGIIVLNDGAPQARWQAFVHEKVHMWLDDAAVELPKNEKGESELEERICNVIASAIVSEMIAHAPTKPVT